MIADLLETRIVDVADSEVQSSGSGNAIRV